MANYITNHLLAILEDESEATAAAIEAELAGKNLFEIVAPVEYDRSEPMASSRARRAKWGTAWGTYDDLKAVEIDGDCRLVSIYFGSGEAVPNYETRKEIYTFLMDSFGFRKITWSAFSPVDERYDVIGSMEKVPAAKLSADA